MHLLTGTRIAAAIALAAGVFFVGCQDEDETDGDAGPTDAGTDAGDDGPEIDPAAPFAVVEIFTSEGCSSCPYADEIVNEIVERQLAGERVFPMAWHVDYWDYLGWPDPYAKEEHTERQEHYVSTSGGSGLVTPDLWVNAKKMVWQYTLQSVNDYIDQQLQVDVDTSVTLWLDEEPTSSLKVEYLLEGAPEGSFLTLVLVERSLENSVTSGENAGEILYHENVVRAFEYVPVEGQGSTEITFPDDVLLEKSSLIGFVQTVETLEIHGATAIEIIN